MMTDENLCGAHGLALETSRTTRFVFFRFLYIYFGLFEFAPATLDKQ